MIDSRGLSRALGLLICCASFAWSEYFADYDFAMIAPPEPIDQFYQVGWRGTYATGGLDHWVQASYLRRFGGHFLWGAAVGLQVQVQALELELNFKYNLKNSLRTETYSDYILLSAGPWWQNTVWDPACGESCRQGEFIGFISAGYGRDQLLSANSTWGFRWEFLLGATLGGTVNRLATGVFGIPTTKSSPLFLELRGGVFWF